MSVIPTCGSPKVPPSWNGPRRCAQTARSVGSAWPRPWNGRSRGAFGVGRSSNAAPSWRASVRVAGHARTLNRTGSRVGAAGLSRRRLHARRLLRRTRNQFCRNGSDGHVGVSWHDIATDRRDHPHGNRQFGRHVHLTGGPDLRDRPVHLDRRHLLQPPAGEVEHVRLQRLDVLAQHVVDFARRHLLARLDEPDLLHGRAAGCRNRWPARSASCGPARPATRREAVQPHRSR